LVSAIVGFIRPEIGVGTAQARALVSYCLFPDEVLDIDVFGTRKLLELCFNLKEFFLAASISDLKETR
jgi:hypothetical protein